MRTRSRGCIGTRGIFENIAQDLQIAFLQNLERSPTRKRRRRRVVLNPVPIDKLVEVLARLARPIHPRHIEAAGILKREKDKGE